MENFKRPIIKFAIILLSVFFIDGGRSILLVSSNIEILLSLHHSNDIEVPHQHQVSSFSTDEKYLEPVGFDFLCSDPDIIKFPASVKVIPQSFLNSIWQPPKFV